MGTTEAGRKLREQVCVFMGGMPIPLSTPAGEAPVCREDGVVEFYKHWQVRGESPTSGLFATYADNDDVIEFGLTERHGNEVRNVLQATLVLAEDGGTLNVLSETNTELNLDAIVTPSRAVPLDVSLLYFRDVFFGD